MQDTRGVTPLMLAARGGQARAPPPPARAPSLPRFESCVRASREARAHPSPRPLAMRRRALTLRSLTCGSRWCAQIGLATALLGAGAHTETPSAHGCTAFSMACEEGQCAAARVPHASPLAPRIRSVPAPRTHARMRAPLHPRPHHTRWYPHPPPNRPAHRLDGRSAWRRARIVRMMMSRTNGAAMESEREAAATALQTPDCYGNTPLMCARRRSGASKPTCPLPSAKAHPTAMRRSTLPW